MKFLFLAASSFLAIVAQMIAGNNFFLFNFLDLGVILIAYWVTYRSRTQALFVGSLTGILMDAVLGWPLGYNGFGKTLAAFAMGQAAKRFNIEGAGVRFVLITLSCCVNSLSIFILFGLLQRASNTIYLGASLIQAVTTAAAGVLVLSVLDNYHRGHLNRAS